MGERGYNTNLAAEYYVLSVLYRLGADAYLTVGNKKSIDLIVNAKGRTLTVDVKGLRDTSCFPVDNWTKKEPDHFFVFVSFQGRIENPNRQPEVYVVPSLELENVRKELDGDSLVYRNPKGNRTVVQLNRLRKLEDKYKNRWQYLVELPPEQTPGVSDILADIGWMIADLRKRLARDFKCEIEPEDRPLPETAPSNAKLEQLQQYLQRQADETARQLHGQETYLDNLRQTVEDPVRVTPRKPHASLIPGEI